MDTVPSSTIAAMDSREFSDRAAEISAIVVSHLENEIRTFVCTFDGDEYVVRASTRERARYVVAKRLAEAFNGPIGKWFPKIKVRVQR